MTPERRAEIAAEVEIRARLRVLELAERRMRYRLSPEEQVTSGRLRWVEGQHSTRGFHVAGEPRQVRRKGTKGLA
jgi:hypothetical protein